MEHKSEKNSQIQEVDDMDLITVRQLYKNQSEYLNKEITNKKACEILGMTRGSFFRYMKELNIQ